jgi:uncharacterized glyoxalase superfamily metalloenzyme YdcJ
VDAFEVLGVAWRLLEPLTLVGQRLAADLLRDELQEQPPDRHLLAREQRAQGMRIDLQECTEFLDERARLGGLELAARRLVVLEVLEVVRFRQRGDAQVLGHQLLGEGGA